MLILAWNIHPAANAAEKTFKGRVIYVNSSEIEVKKGKSEMVFALTPELTVTGDEGDAVDVSALELCQVVTVTYILENDGEKAKSIVINKPSDCHIKK